MVVSDTWARVLIAGHPVLDFVNTLDNRFSAKGTDERLLTYSDLLEFLQASNLLSLHQARDLPTGGPSQSRQRALHRTQALRENLATVFYALSDGAPANESLTALQTEFETARKLLALKWTSGEEGHAYWDWNVSGGNVDWPVSILAREAESLLLSKDMGSVRQCAHSTCRWLFLDLSKNHTRRWCDMKLCGNRAKASRFQARRSGST
jgi:predicted RNA-binding Zn ribbon-like protein